MAGADVTGEPAQLLPETEYLLDRDKAAMGTVLTAYNGGDPLRDPPAFGYPESMQVEIERRMILEQDRTRKMNESIFQNPESGWGQIKTFMDGVFDRYKTANDAQLIKKPKNEQEAIAQMEQMRPVQVDPNEVANMRQLAVKLDQQMKQFGTSFWTDPRTKGYADWLNREAGPGSAGFMQSGEQPVEMGAVGRAAYSAWQGIEGIASAPMALIHGSWDIGRRAIQALGGPDIGPSYPTNYVEAEDGTLISNGGKAPSILDGLSMAYAYATNQNVEQFAAQAGRAQEWEMANRAGFSGIVTSVSRLGGELVGLAPGFGAAAKAGEVAMGTLTTKGMQMLGTLRLAKGVQQSDRALKIIGAMNKGIGQAAGMAAYESISYGRVEGYGAAFTHGLMMAPVLMTLGALGKKTEWFASKRMNMPGVAARAVAGALEGAGFGAVETIMPDVLPTAWGFIRDPNQETWEAYAKNMLAFSLVKMATGRTTGAASPEELAMKRGIGRAQFAEKVARGEARPEEVAVAPVNDAAKLRELGEVSMRSREGKTSEERTAARTRQREIEAELDVQEFGKGPAEEAVADYQGPAKPETKMPSMDEIKAAKAMPSGPEKRRRIIEMLDAASKSFGREAAKGLETLSKQELEKQTKELDAMQQLQEAGDIQQSMVKGIDVSKLKSAHKRALAEIRSKETFQVPGKEPQPHKTVQDKPAPEKQMFQEGGREGLEPEKLVSEDAAALAAKEERRVATSPDPLEDPRFRELPEGLQDEILAASDPLVRKQIFARYAKERRSVPRETFDPAEHEARVTMGKVQRLFAERQKLIDAGIEEGVGDLAAQIEKLIVQLPDTPEIRKSLLSGFVDNEGRPLLDSINPELEQRKGQPRDLSGGRRGPQSLQAQPTQQIDPSPGVKPVRAMDIYSEMEGRPGRQGLRIPFTKERIGGTEGDVVRVPMRGGKIQGGGRGVLGVFKMFENLVRTQEGRDLAVASHEWSHAMHRHTSSQGGGKDFIKAAKAQVENILQSPDGQKIWSEVQETLKDYPGSENMPKWLKWMETWAEWHARNLLGEVGLDAKLPALSAYMRGWLAAPQQVQLRDQYRRIQNMIYRYNAQGSMMRVRQSRVSGGAPPTETEKATSPSIISRTLQTLNKAIFDDMAELKSSQEKWLKAVGRKPEDVSIMEDPARLFDTLRMTANKTVEHFVMDGIRQPDGTKVPGLRQVMKNVEGRTEDFIDFVVAVRSMELYRTGKDVQLPPQDYIETVKQLSEKNPDFVDNLSNLKRWTDALVDYVAGAGSIGQDDAQRIKDAYVVYVPFFRAIQGPAQHGQGRGVAERGTGLSRIKGSTYEIRDPFVALQQVARSMVAKAHQNQVMSALFKMAMGQEAGGLATIVPRTSVPTDHPLRQLLDAIEKKVELPGSMQEDLEGVFEALRQVDALNPQTITTFSQKVIPTGEKNIIAFTPRLSEMEIASLVSQGAARQTVEAANNKLQWLEVDTKVYESLMGIDKMPQLPEAMQPVMRWLQAPRDVVRFFATGVAPGFVAANLIRDALSAPIFDRQGQFKPFGGFVKLIRGAIEYHKNGEMRELYEELGVKTSSFWTEGRQRALIGEQTTLWQKAQAMADRVQNWFSHPENYIRMAEFSDSYKAAKEAGKSEIEARMEALESGREITVNFARAGVWARVMNQLVPYFNAGLQGQRKLWGQLIAGGADTKGDEAKARVQRGAILNGLANITVPATLLWLLNKDEEWYQDLPEWRKVGYFNMKIGDEIVSVPKPFEAGTLFGSLPEIMLDNLFGKNPASTKAAMISLAGPYLDSIGAWVPAFLKPIFEVATNENLFTGRPLTPEWISRSNPPTEQATFYTTETAKIASRALNGILTPTEVEALLGGYTAGSATSLMKMIDEVAGLKDHPGLAMNPLARFFSQQEHGQSDFVDKLYKLSVDLDQNEDTLDSQGMVMKRRVDTAKRQISALRKRHQSGQISKEEAERRSYELARPIIEANNQRRNQ